MGQSPSETEVVVVGGGPAGLTIAAELARQDVQVTVIERRTTEAQSRAAAVQPRVLETLAARGLMDGFLKTARAFRTECEIYYFVWAGMQGLRYDLLASEFNYSLFLPQHLTEQLLSAWAEEAGADVRRGVEYLGHDQSADSVTIHTQTRNGGTDEFNAQYLIGADGAQSKVRAAAGLPFSGRETTMTAILADAVLPYPWPTSVRVARNEAGWILTYPLGNEITRFIVVAHARRNTPRSEPVTIDEARASINAILGEDFGFTEAKWMSRYGDASLAVPQLRLGRTLLVGESARVHYPAGGIGMNYCILDAFNLGWKLGEVVRGRASSALLDTYHDERYPVIRNVLNSVDIQCKLLFDFSPAGLAVKEFIESQLIPIPEVNAVLCDQLTGLGISYHRDTDAHPADGLRVGEIGLASDDGPAAHRHRSYTEVAAGSAFVFLAQCGPGDFAIEELPVHVTGVTVSEMKLPDHLVGARALLIRPDGYVARAWTDIPAAAEVKATLKQLLHPAATVTGPEVPSTIRA